MWAPAALRAVIALAITLLVRDRTLKLRTPKLQISNYRGRRLAVVGGITVAVSLAATEVAVNLAQALLPAGPAALPDPSSAPYLGTLALALGFFALGLLDDFAGNAATKDPKGFGGHLRALRQGRVTTGAVKAFGGVALAFTVGLFWEHWSVPAAALDAVLIALSANLLNLLDLRPGRAAKGFFICWIPLAVAARDTAFLPVSSTVAAALAVWLPADLGERGALGDAGANMAGAVLGAGLVIVLGIPGRVAVAALLLMLTLVSERVSFSGVIERTGALRWLDGLGRENAG